MKQPTDATIILNEASAKAHPMPIITVRVTSTQIRSLTLTANVMDTPKYIIMHETNIDYISKLPCENCMQSPKAKPTLALLILILHIHGMWQGNSN